MSGIVSKTAAAPIDRVKLLLQTQRINSEVTVPYKGMSDCFVRVYREQGLGSFWRGNVANLMRYCPSQALSFALKDFYKKVLNLDPVVLQSDVRKELSDSRALWFLVWGNLFAAGAAGGTSMFLLYPLELARTRVATDVSRRGELRKFSGALHCLHQVYTENGVRGLYAGLPVSLFGVVVFRGLYMGGYDIAKTVMGIDNRITQSTEKQNSEFPMTAFLSRLGAAQIVTTLAGTMCYPIDTVRRRIMMQAKEVASSCNGGLSKPVRMPYYRNTWHCFVRIIREEGPKGLFQGLGANLVRGMSGSLLLVGYDELRCYLDGYF